MDKNHEVSQDDRPHILSLFKKALYTTSEDMFEDYYDYVYAVRL